MTPSPFGSGRRCAVLGSPIVHSLSPVLHRAAYAALGLDWTYEAHEVGSAGLSGFVHSRDPSWRGLSLTAPLKEVALALGEVDPEARLAGGANTLVFEPAGRRLFNTDVGGLVDALRAAGVAALTDVVVLGAGATARSALVSVSRLGCRRVTVLARRPAGAGVLADVAASLDVQLTVRPWSDPVPSADLAVSTVTAGAADDRADQVSASGAIVFDVVYDPWPTSLAATAAAAGRPVLNGLDLLAHQAVRQLRLMTGEDVSAELLLEAGRQALSERAAR